MSLRETLAVRGDETLRPFTLALDEAELDDLRERLRRSRWPDELPGIGWRDGIPVAVLRELAERWGALDWRAQEARLNAWPQVRTTIDGTGVHAIVARSPQADALPLVVTHGWPGSVVELLGVLGPLTDPAAHGGDPADAFHVIAPSLPGYGLSGPTAEAGWDVVRASRAIATLMERLGHERYGAQGGDWGSFVSRTLGLLHPDRVVGVHQNMTLTPAPRDPGERARLDEEDRRRLGRASVYRKELEGYARQQGTRPQTLAYALTDSPVGQLAWIAEKFRAWTTGPAEGEEVGPPSVADLVVDIDDLLANVALYWFTGTAGSSARLYRETDLAGAHDHATGLAVPTGVAVFPDDIFLPVRRLAEARDHVVHWTEMPRGGHFAAMEEPQLLVEDVRAFFRPLR